MKTCTVQGCDRKHHAKGLCRHHYDEKRRDTCRDTDLLREIQPWLLDVLNVQENGIAHMHVNEKGLQQLTEKIDNRLRDRQ